ncbi:uncharacterized protein NPIL_326841 [Nephila pilipes]|uniref:Uncharacterized protein n=1 Tax=Nephila pilipes TaxID=299642 RepID=A0A8X6NSR6_NEPPI|nr:uncharacterized protein NPIL_326841 [Nephila pilipes]
MQRYKFRWASEFNPCLDENNAGPLCRRKHLLRKYCCLPSFVYPTFSIISEYGFSSERARTWVLLFVSLKPFAMETFNRFHRGRIFPKEISYIATFSKNIYSQQEKNIYGDINFIRRSFYSVAYIFPSNNDQTNSRDLARKFMEFIIIVLLIVYEIADLQGIFEWLRRVPLGLIFSSLVTSFTSTTVRVGLITKRRLLMTTVENLLRISKCNHRQRQRDKLYLIIGFSLCFIIPVGFLLYTANLCFPGMERILEDYVKNNCFGWSSESKWINCFMQFSIDTFILNQQYTLPGFVVVLCCYMFSLLKRGVESFKHLTRHQQDFKTFFGTYLEYSEQIYSCVTQIENSISFLLLILFGFMAFSIFTVSTFLLTVNYKRVEIIVVIPQIISAIFMIMGFYIASLRAVAINRSAIKIKEYIHGTVASLKSSDDSQHVLLLAMVNNFPSKVVITSWKLFVLKRSFIWGTLSGLVTYGAILSQLGKF